MASPPPSPPRPKKPKLTADNSDEEQPERPPLPSEPGVRPKYKRRKIAIFFGYCGAGYQGMQKNPGAKTIEADLEEALFLSWAVPESDRGNPRRCDWGRSARTDKGVSAVGQVVSGRFYVDPPGLVERLNSHLSSQIKVFGFNRVTASFNAKKFCDRRRYVYLLPVFALDPEAHRCRDSAVLTGLEKSGTELTGCLECCTESEGKVTNLGDNSENCELAGDLRSESEVGEKTELGNGHFSEIGGAEGVFLCGGLKSETNTASERKLEIGNVENVELEEKIDDSSVVSNDEEKTAPGNTAHKQISGRSSKFHYGEKVKERLNSILQRYVGTHNFHNFTTRTKAEDPSSQRYIVSFHANTVVNIKGLEFVKCEVVGQSFMLHQIRKMIGLAVAIIRDCASETLMDSALRKDINIKVPTAPEVGLYLDECLFSSYNQKWKDSHEKLSMDSYAEQAEDFKMKHIYAHIASMEQKEGAIAQWLHSLNQRNYPDIHTVEANGAGSVGECACTNKTVE